eukprot:SAG31_NODE_2212_length_6174_cov_11.856790_5_plen_152_part_00
MPTEMASTASLAAAQAAMASASAVAPSSPESIGGTSGGPRWTSASRRSAVLSSGGATRVPAVAVRCFKNVAWRVGLASGEQGKSRVDCGRSWRFYVAADAAVFVLLHRAEQAKGRRRRTVDRLRCAEENLPLRLVAALRQAGGCRSIGERY